MAKGWPMTATVADKVDDKDFGRPVFDPALAARLAALVAAAPGRSTQRSFAPFTGRVLGEVPVCTPEDVVEAVRLARAAQGAWAARPLKERKQILLRFHDLVLDRQSEILDILQHETGKARVSAFEEVIDVAATARYYARTARSHLKPRRRRGALPLITRTIELHQPKGVIGVISPWNYPLTLAASDALPALLAGNAIVIKPDAQTPFSALIAVDLLYEAGLPRDLFKVVTGRGSVLGTPMIEQVDYMMFTGSTLTGRLIAEQCGRQLIGFSAELGGKNPMIVLADADIEKTVEGSVRSCFSNSGQLCISIERMYVEDSIYDTFVPALAERIKNMKLSAELTWDAEMGSLISQDQLDTICEHVTDAVAKGAKVLAGGKARPDLGPLFYEPTLLIDVNDEMTLCRGETFGPVVSIYRVRDEAEAITRANDTEYGLNASVWSTARHGAEVAKQIKAGTVNVNEGYASGWASHDAPMGGMKHSGMGRRHGREGITKYTESQTVAVQRVMPVGTIPWVAPQTGARLLSTGLKVLKRTPGVK